MDRSVAVRVPRAASVQLFAPTATSRVQWRLLSANNRDIGHGAGAYLDVESCRLAVKEVQHGLAELQANVRRTSERQWAWVLSRDAAPVAMSAHGFDRLIRCEQGLEYFRAGIREAEIAPGLLVSDSRRWGAPMPAPERGPAR